MINYSNHRDTTPWIDTNGKIVADAIKNVAFNYAKRPITFDDCRVRPEGASRGNEKRRQKVSGGKKLYSPKRIGVQRKRKRRIKGWAAALGNPIAEDR